ncbi:HET-domain-containing protein, partial [Lepidopterella palustris CBS 459.81]
MRLLQVLQNGDFRLTEKFLDHAIPRYAILSHTWGDESEEVTFDDMVEGSGRDKAGYKKIEFCGQQAAKDGLQYFWVDSCCIKKLDVVELSESLNSMFRWYHGATRCYVYLSDVSSTSSDTGVECDLQPWKSDFRKSKWFTRGWTLQELLAPRVVDFFSLERKRLGNKSSLEQQIREITGIPTLALQGAHLSQFSVNDRLSWIERRQTKLEEDLAYSLLGIFGVNLPLRYGEGRVTAFQRLEREIDKLEKCVQDLRLTDPRDDKRRIEDTKGGLLEGSYRWILENGDFNQWRNNQESQLLWIKGDPGKGKTMLLCGIIDELKKPTVETHLLSFFYCQATDSRINNATAVLRGLLYLLIDQQPSLVSHIRKRHDLAGRSLFEDANAWVALSDIFTSILQDPGLKNTFLIVDALDECTVGLPKLLDFITEKSSASPHVKWLVSSRNWPPIEEQLDKARNKVKLRLELNAESVSAAVTNYIQQKVHHLVQEKKYDNKTRDAVLDHLLSNANNTFLWVALVCQNLRNIPRGRVRARLSSFPSGLDSLYERMMTQISESEDSELCKKILASVAIVYEPITLTELTSLVEMLDDISDDIESLQEIIGLCGSFLTVRNSTIYFVHQSAKDYLLAKASAKIFPFGMGEAHHEIFSRSLEAMSRTLRRDIYDLGSLGYPIESVKQPDPDPLTASRYSCVYWVDHLCDWNSDRDADQKAELLEGGEVDVFLKEKYLYWLEALSLCRSMPKGVLAIGKLEAFIRGRSDASALLELVYDARRFIMYHKQAIATSPLQAYSSALIFSPTSSLIRHNFRGEEPQWVTIKPKKVVAEKWSACLQTLEGHSRGVMSVAFSHDSSRLASASYDNT